MRESDRICFPVFRYIQSVDGNPKPDLLTVVTPLMRAIAQLPKYTLVTQELSDNAKNLRTAVLNAREPDELLFKELPEAFGYPAFHEEMATDAKAISDFFRTLRDALSELEQPYDILLNSVEQLLAEAFGLKPTSEKTPGGTGRQCRTFVSGNT